MSSLSPFLITLTDYTPCETSIGSGSFGKVYHVIATSGPHKSRHFAIKQLPVASPELGQEIDHARELELLTSTDHPAVLRLTGFSLPTAQSPFLSILMDFMSNGSLQSLLENPKNPKWNATSKTKVLFGITSGLAYLHGRGVIHRDLKPHNILLNDQLEVVICDFGASRFGDLKVTAKLGTRGYMAPEISKAQFDLSGKDAFATDVFSFAMIVLDLFAEVRGGGDARQRLIDRGLRPKRPKGIPDWHWELVNECWKVAGKERPTFKAILERMKGNENYVLEGAERGEVREYEEKVFRRVNEPTGQEWDEVEFPEEEQDLFFQRLDEWMGVDEEEDVGNQSMGLMFSTELE
jgi:serine/threonine protein kinase